MNESTNWNIISLGGSLVMPDEIDIEFVDGFRKSILELVSTGNRFLIIVGGGKVSRNYQAALSDLNPSSLKSDLDWIGIGATQLNANLVRLAFGELAYPQLVSDPTIQYPGINDSKVVVGFGWKPGWSTDYVATCFAEMLHAKRIINLTNIDYVYTADPKIDSTAVPIESATWEEYLSYIPIDWKPGLSTPFDPIAAKKARELGLELSFVSAGNSDHFNKCITGESFPGSIIKGE